MKSSKKDQMRGKLHLVKGKVKKKVGQIANRPDMELQGLDERATGSFEVKRAQVKKALGG